MEKSPEAFRTIREVADAMDLPQHVLRFWETRFPQIRPLKRAGGRRYYRPDDVERLRVIRRLLYDEGYTIKGVQRLFKEQGAQALLAAASGSRPPFPVEAAAPPEAPEDSYPSAAGPAPEAGTRNGPAPALAYPTPPASAEELAALREILAEIHEAEQILTKSRAQGN